MTISSSPSKEQFLADLLERYGIDDSRGIEALGLIKTVSNLLDTIVAERMRSHNVSGPRWRMLLRLFLEEERGSSAGLSPSTLSQFQHVSKNTISTLLRRLEDQGLVQRHLDSHDRRRFVIRLTPQGRDLVHSTVPEHAEYLNHLLLGLSPDEYSAMVDGLKKLRQTLQLHAGDCHKAR
ncbi:MAG: MarR family transcriptional regulator [Chloroflexi bacterium]|nr:MarR family transcriptional regulator [Chloroflexota bacterium]